MKIIYLIILSLLTQHGVMSQEIKSNDPSKLTIEFIKDYKKWNDYAYNLSQTQNNDENIEKEILKIQVYPNPTANEFTLIPGSFINEKVSIRVTDVMGRIVYQAVVTGKQVYIYGKNLIPGIYQVQVRQGSEKQSIRVIKQ